MDDAVPPGLAHAIDYRALLALGPGAFWKTRNLKHSHKTLNNVTPPKYQSLHKPSAE